MKDKKSLYRGKKKMQLIHCNPIHISIMDIVLLVLQHLQVASMTPPTIPIVKVRSNKKVYLK